MHLFPSLPRPSWEVWAQFSNCCSEPPFLLCGMGKTCLAVLPWGLGGAPAGLGKALE